MAIKKHFALFLLSFVFLFSGCQNQISQTSQVSEKLSDEKMEVVASFYPLAYFAQAIGGDKVVVKNLAGNAEIHDFSPSPQDIASVYDADLVILQGAGLENAWSKDLIPELTRKNVSVLVVSDFLELQKNEGNEEHEHEKHEEEEAHEHHEHHHGEYDPHTWLDPVLAQKMIDVIVKKMLEKDTKNTDFFLNNAENLKKKFADFDSSFQEKMKNCEKKEVIVSHDAFFYLARRYGFATHAIAGISTQDEPSAALLARLQEEAAEGIGAILAEQNSVQRFAQTLAYETGLQMLPVSTLEVSSENFLDGMQKNLESFSTALSCQ